jgi:2,3-dihydroxy-p-cumate/2,3-dihydroxybenzoate 3,4-dioxygenase
VTDFRYRGLAGVTLSVTNLKQSMDFYQDLVGLELVDCDSRQAVFRCGDRHHDVILQTAGAPGIKRVSFELESLADWERAKEHFRELGHRVEVLSATERSPLHQGATFRLREPSSGLQFEFLTDAERPEQPFAATVARCARLGHVVIEVADLPTVLDFLIGQANFRTSDYVESRIYFLRCFPNTLHHSFAVQQGVGNRLHHVNLMVTDLDDVGRAMNRMKKAGVEIVFGPGRHEPSGSVFLYFLDPDGMTVEYSFGMEEFPEASARLARNLDPKPEVLDVWGSVPAPRFAKVGAIEDGRV